ncbi:MAG: HTH domain-containing protein [Halobacteriaceae archaeon]
MSAGATLPSIRLELFLRGDTYGTFDTQEAMLDRVRALERTDYVDETVVNGVEKRVRATGSSSEALRTFEAFESWAAARGMDLGPAFDRRTQTTLVSDDVYDVVVFPVACLAVYEDDDIRAVAPARNDDEVITVEAILDALENREFETWLTRLDARHPVRAST